MTTGEAIAWEDIAMMWIELDDAPEAPNEDPADERLERLEEYGWDDRND